MCAHVNNTFTNSWSFLKGTRWTGGSSSVEIHALVHKEYCCRFCVKRVKEADFIAGETLRSIICYSTRDCRRPMPRKCQLEWKGNTLVASSAQNVKRDTPHTSQTQQCHGQELNQLSNAKSTSELLCNYRSEFRKASGRATRTVSVNECIVANVSP